MFARAWISGYGSKFVPRVPFEVARLGEDERVVFAHHRRDTVPQVIIAPDSRSPEGTRFALRDADSAADVLEFIEDDDKGCFEPAWRISTRHFELAWPPNWSLWSTDASVDWPFELTPSGGDGPRDAMIYAQGPWERDQAPQRSALVGRGMREGERGRLDVGGRAGDWIRVEYVHDGVPWSQCRCFGPVDETSIVLITGQAPTADFAPVWEAIQFMLGGLQARG